MRNYMHSRPVSSYLNATSDARLLRRSNLVSMQRLARRSRIVQHEGDTVKLKNGQVWRQATRTDFRTDETTKLTDEQGFALMALVKD